MSDLTVVSHVGILVSDLGRAADELSATLGLTWAPVVEQIVRGRTPAGDVEASVELTWSREGPPYVELLEGAAGSLWHTAGSDRDLHHVGYWADDIPAAVEQLVGRGLTLEVAGIDAAGASPVDYAYLLDRGLRVEVLDSARREALPRWFAPRHA